jgi:hypothetical protein
MPPPSGSDDLIAEVASIMTRVARLPLAARGHLADVLTMSRLAAVGARSPVTTAATPPPNPSATALPNPATELSEPVTSGLSPGTPLAPPRGTGVLPATGSTVAGARPSGTPTARAKAPTPVLGDPRTWPADPARLRSEIILHAKSRIFLLRTEKAGSLSLAADRNGVRVNLAGKMRPMQPQEAERFLARFVVPLLPHRIGRQWLSQVITGRHDVGVLWAIGGERFGGAGAFPLKARDASDSKAGSPAVIAIDENGADWKAVPDLDVMPDIGFLHELYHAAMIQQGRNDGMTEREARIEENRYRHQRGASVQRELP